MIEMLFRSNIFAIVGTGLNKKYPRNKVMLWDEHLKKCIGELKLSSKVIGVKLRRDKYLNCFI